MYKVIKKKEGININFSATFELIDMVCSDVGEILKQTVFHKLGFGILLGIREVLTNAVRYGCGMDASKSVNFDFEINDDKLIILVKDPGNGFNWQIKENEKANSSATHGRGIAILKEYFSSYQYNDLGNQIKLIIEYKEES